MPVLISFWLVDFHELLEDGVLAATAPSCKLHGEMVVAVHVVVVFVVRVLWAKYSGTHAARKVVHVVFLSECGDIGTTQGTVAGGAHEAQTAIIVVFTQWYLDTVQIVGVEFGNDVQAAVLPL
jgi:hypothetical protein